MNMHIPEEYGGAGMHALDGVIVGEELAYGCTGMMTAMEGNGLASAPVIIAGTHEQKVRTWCKRRNSPACSRHRHHLLYAGLAATVLFALGH